MPYCVSIRFDHVVGKLEKNCDCSSFRPYREYGCPWLPPNHWIKVTVGGCRNKIRENMQESAKTFDLVDPIKRV